MCIALKALNSMQGEIDFVQEVQESFIAQTTYYDQKLSALYHAIENEPQLGVVNGYKVYRELKRLLTERRKIKRESYELKNFLNRFEAVKRSVTDIWNNRSLESYDRYTAVKEILEGSYELEAANIPEYIDSIREAAIRTGGIGGVEGVAHLPFK